MLNSCHYKRPRKLVKFMDELTVIKELLESDPAPDAATDRRVLESLMSEYRQESAHGSLSTTTRYPKRSRKPLKQAGKSRTTTGQRLGLSGAAAIILIVIVLVATGSFGAHGRRVVTNPGSQGQLTAFNRQKVVSAVLTANQDEILSQTTEFVDPSGQILNANRVLVDNTSGDAVSETLSSSGGPADALVFNSGSVTHIDYANQVWWTASRGTTTGSLTLQDPESTTAGIQSLVSSGQLTVASTSAELNGQPATELIGQGASPLPGSSLTLWVSQATNLPIQAIGVQSDGSKQITSYQWLDRNEQDLALVTPTAPSEFTQLSGPPPGAVPASPLG
jgi:hypothetical protein